MTKSIQELILSVRKYEFFTSKGERQSSISIRFIKKIIEAANLSKGDVFSFEYKNNILRLKLSNSNFKRGSHLAKIGKDNSISINCYIYPEFRDLNIPYSSIHLPIIFEPDTFALDFSQFVTKFTEEKAIENIKKANLNIILDIVHEEVLQLAKSCIDNKLVERETVKSKIREFGAGAGAIGELNKEALNKLSDFLLGLNKPVEKKASLNINHD